MLVTVVFEFGKQNSQQRYVCGNTMPPHRLQHIISFWFCLSQVESVSANCLFDVLYYKKRLILGSYSCDRGVKQHTFTTILSSKTERVCTKHDRYSRNLQACYKQYCDCRMHKRNWDQQNSFKFY